MQKSDELEVSLPIEDKKLNGKEEILHAQVFVMYDEENPRLLAKSGIAVSLTSDGQDAFQVGT